MKVSVIVPAYNSEKTIEKTIRSIIKQTYKNLEIIVINDGSTDDTKKILSQLEIVDERLIVIDQDNHGVSHARNIGITKSTGSYICFLDADDWYAESFIAETFREGYDICLSGYVSVFEDGEKRNNIYDKIYYLRGTSRTPSNLLKGLLARRLIVSSNNWIIRKEILIINNIYFCEDLSWCEDILFFSEVLLKSENVNIVNKHLTFYNNLQSKNRLSSVSSTRIDQEIFAMNTLKNKVTISDIEEKDEIISIIDNYRIPATLLYTISSILKEDNDVQWAKFKLEEYDSFINIRLINGLRSIKLKLVYLLLTLKSGGVK